MFDVDVVALDNINVHTNFSVVHIQIYAFDLNVPKLDNILKLWIQKKKKLL